MVICDMHLLLADGECDVSSTKQRQSVRQGGVGGGGVDSSQWRRTL